jgi:hypothetical protein
MFEEMFSKRDDQFLRVLLKFYGTQEGIFCIKQLAREMKIHRTEAVRYVDSQIKSGLLKPVNPAEVKRITGKKDRRFTYYKIDLNHSFAHWWFDNKRAIAIEVLVKEIGDEAKPIIKKLKRKIKTESILEELKLLQLL